MASIEHIAAAMGRAWRFATGEADTARDAIAHVFEDSADGMMVIGEDGRVVAASATAAALLGEPGHSLVGRFASTVLPLSMLETVRQAFADGRRGVPTPRALAHIGDPGAGGRVVQYVTTLSELRRRGGPLPRRVVGLTFWDETERRRREQELVFVGTHDHLTGALTRSELVRVVDAVLSGERRRAPGLAMVLVDLRRFKAVNDTFGHGAGDMVLQQAVGRLKAAGFDTVARLGGNLFAAVRPGRLPLEETSAFCHALLERLVLPYALGGNQAVVGASLGLTHTDVSGYEPDVLLAHAELALLQARAASGTGFVRFTAEMDQRLRQKQQMDLALRRARERGELSIVYQPQVALASGELVGVEALLRWQHPELGAIPPERFIPAAEENGEIIEIGRWLLHTATAAVASWPFPTRLAVAVSPVQFEFVDVLGDVRDALAASGLPAHQLDIEIGESLFLARADYMAAALDRLRRHGVGTTLDRFGTGYAALGYLGRLPVDKVKIDRGFVSRLPADGEAGAIIRAVMNLSETLNKVVVADGIETADQAWMLRMMGCRVGQGVHFGHPRSSEEMARWFTGREPASARGG